jgi:hypothetical protein
MTDQPTPTMGRNPSPRPALRRDSADTGISVARPGTGHEGGTSHATATGVEDAAEAQAKFKDKKRSKGDPPRTAIKAAKHSKPDKHHKKPKPAKPEQARQAAAADHAEHELIIALPKSVRKALKHAASEHGTTPERLVSLVISEWLDH